MAKEIDYQALQQDAMRSVVRAVLSKVSANGLPGEHHFYISFLTQAPGIILSKRLKQKYPHDMTIVLQHRFWDLIVSEDRFEVKLTFDGVPERLVVPYRAIKVFIDPSVGFGLQFDEADADRNAAPRHALNLDATFDTIDAAHSDGPRASTMKKSRTRRSKIEKEGVTGASLATKDALRATAPSPEPASAAAGGTAASGDEASDKPAAVESGAKILSLDQFRKK
jgi:hypothetical protein